MNCKIPFTKDIDFEHKLYEITSISLEHETKVEEGVLKGNFIISGDYKSHEVSINKEPFSYILPFEITLADNIDEATIEFLIEDFTYEVIENSILRVNIDFSVIASPKETLEIKDDDTRLLGEQDNLFTTPDANLFEEITDLKESKEEEKEIGMPQEENKKEEEQINIKEEINTNIEETKKLSEDTIIDNINPKDDAYATYHIHMVSDGESVETICSMYNTNMAFLSEYNDLNNLNEGDKLIIPETDE